MKSQKKRNGGRRAKWAVVPLTWLLYVMSSVEGELFCVDPRARTSTTRLECPTDDQRYYESVRQCCGPNRSGAPSERRFERVPRFGEKGSIPRNCYRPLEPVSAVGSPICESRARLLEELNLCCVGSPEFIPGGSSLIVGSPDSMTTTGPTIKGLGVGLGSGALSSYVGRNGIDGLSASSGFSGGRRFRRDIIKNIPPYYLFAKRALVPAGVLEEVEPGLFCRTGSIVNGVQTCRETHPYNTLYDRCCGTQRVVSDAGPDTAHRSGLSRAGCSDLSVPGRSSDCPQKAYLCLDPVYFDVMTKQCPATCGRCGFPRVGPLPPVLSAAAAAPRAPFTNYLNYYGAFSPSIFYSPVTPTNFDANLIGGTVPVGGGVCADRAVPGRPSDCLRNAALCFLPFYASLMAVQCPATCGLCPFRSGLPPYYSGADTASNVAVTPSAASNLARLVDLGNMGGAGGGVGLLRYPLNNLAALVGRGNVQSGQRFPLVGRQPTIPGCVDNLRADAPITECPSNKAKCFLPEWQAFMMIECAYTCDRNGCRTGRLSPALPTLNVSDRIAPIDGTILNLNSTNGFTTGPSTFPTGLSGV